MKGVKISCRHIIYSPVKSTVLLVLFVLANSTLFLGFFSPINTFIYQILMPVTSVTYFAAGILMRWDVKKRLREMAIRKLFGASNTQLFVLIYIKTALFIIVSFFFSTIVLEYIYSKTSYIGQISIPLSVVLVAIMLILSLLTGLLPALKLLNTNMVKQLRSK